MNLIRSPTGSGPTVGRSGSQPNLTSKHLLSEGSDNTRATMRNKRKYTDDNNEIKEDLRDMRQQMSQIMELVTSLSNNQAEFMAKVSGDVSEIKEEVRGIKQMTNQLTLEQSAIKVDVLNLQTKTSETEKKIEKIRSDITQLKTNNSLTVSATGTLEEMLTEIREREHRSKNIIIVGVNEPVLENKDERKINDREEVLRITRTIINACPEPENIFRLGKYNPNKNRLLKVCYKSQETATSVLRNRNSFKSEAIKIFSDQTPQQQAYLRNLKEELKRRNDDGEKDLTIRYVSGTPKITKLLPKN